jgi:hypothetical protein
MSEIISLKLARRTWFSTVPIDPHLRWSCVAIFVRNGWNREEIGYGPTPEAALAACRAKFQATLEKEHR